MIYFLSPVYCSFSMSRNVGHVCPLKIQISLRIRALIRIFAERIRIAKDAKFLHVYNEDWSDCVDAKSDLSLRWAHMSEGAFPHVAAHMSSARNLLLFYARFCIGDTGNSFAE